MGTSSHPTTRAQSRFRPGVVRQARNSDRAKLELITLEARLALSGTPTVINFDNLPTGSVITTQYPGVTFSSDAGEVNRTDNFYNLGSSTPNYLCSGPAAGSIDCVHSTFLDFQSPVNGFSFLALGDNAPGIQAQVRVVQKGGTSTTVGIAVDGNFQTADLVDLKSFQNVIRIEMGVTGRALR
jgi:hypothetical protein